MPRNREQEMRLINSRQDEYVEQVKELLCDNSSPMKEVTLCSKTGTGKTIMLSKLVNKMQDYFFLITTLSRGGLNKQVEESLRKNCIGNNWVVYGDRQFTKNTIIQEEDIRNAIPENVPVVWVRDESHINTHLWHKCFYESVDKILNMSATPKNGGGGNCVVTNFADTCMLRSVKFHFDSTPVDALEKLIQIKKEHSFIKGYNPCAIIRALDDRVVEMTESFCNENGLNYINIIDENADLRALCEDDNENDVIIVKFKADIGVDIRRAHIIYMTNVTTNVSTTVQVIGRCRRNALLYRDDIDIFKLGNKFRESTQTAHAYFNYGDVFKRDQNRNKDEDILAEEIALALCNRISVQQLKVGSTIRVRNGRMANGLIVEELVGCTGSFVVEIDRVTGFNCFKDDRCKFYNKKTVNVIPERMYKGVSESSWASREAHSEFAFDWGAMQVTDKEIVTVWDDYNYHHKVSAPKQDVEEYFKSSVSYAPYSLVRNDKLTATLRGDTFRWKKDDSGCVNSGEWVEAKPITHLISTDCKFDRFLSKKYKSQLDEFDGQKFSKCKDIYDYDKKCNSMRGYVVEQYAKWLLYGDNWLCSQNGYSYIKQALEESTVDVVNDAIVVRACMLKYKDEMVRAYGRGVVYTIRFVSASELIKEHYKSFVDDIVSLGTKVANFISTEFGVAPRTYECRNSYDPCLSIDHISGLADFLNDKKIVDIKCTPTIEKRHLKQVLAYHYLSTKRSDLNIDEVIVYNPLTDECARCKV